MNRNWIVLAVAGMLGTQAFAEDASQFKDRKDQESYAIGAQTGRTLKKDGVDVNVDMLIKGLKEGLNGDKLMMGEKELRMVMGHVQQEAHKNMVINRRAQGERNKEEGAKFLAENAKKEGIVTTGSGLQYKVLSEGKGRKPFLNDTVLLNYRGTLLNGVEFDASAEGKPAQLTLAQTVLGFKEALQMMPIGSKWQIFLPAGLAYGERGTGGEVGPNQTLVFEVELVGVKEGIPGKADAPQS